MQITAKRLIAFFGMAVMFLSLALPALSFAEGAPGITYYEESNAFPADEVFFNTWGKNSSGDPIFYMAPNEYTDTNSEGSVYIFPILFDTAAPVTGTAYPFVYWVDEETSTGYYNEIMKVTFGQNSFLQVDLSAPKAYLEAGKSITDAITVHWFSEDNTESTHLATSILNFSIAQNLPGTVPVTYYDNETATPLDDYDYAWGKNGNIPVLHMAPTEDTGTIFDGAAYEFPIWVNSDAPSSTTGQVYPFPYYTDGSDSFYGTMRFENVTGDNNFVFLINVPTTITGAVEEVFTIHWFNENSTSSTHLATTKLHVSIAEELPSDEPAMIIHKVPAGRLTYSAPSGVYGPAKPVSAEYIESTGSLIYTVNKPSEDDILQTYAPGMTEIIGDFKVEGPEGYDQVVTMSGSFTIDEFIAYVTNPRTPYTDYPSVGNGIRLYQITETASGITVTPGTYGVTLGICWKNSTTGELYAETVTASLNVTDEGYLNIPSDKLPSVDPVPAARLAVGKLPLVQHFSKEEVGGSFTAADGHALFSFAKDPDDVTAYAEANGIDVIGLPLWITPPEGYTHYELQGTSFSGGARPIPTLNANGTDYTVVEFNRPVYHERDGIVTQNTELIIIWSKADGSAKYESLRFESAFPNTTWMDIYWAPAPEAKILFDPTSPAEAGIKTGFSDYILTCSFDENDLPTFAEMEAARNVKFSISAPDGAVYCVSNISSGGRSTGYSPATAQEQSAWLDGSRKEYLEYSYHPLYVINKKTAGSEGIEYFVVEQEKNKIFLIQFYDENGDLIKVENGTKDGYYLQIDCKAFVFTLNGSVVNTVSSAVSIPTLALGEGVAIDPSWYFTANLYPQKETQGKLKYFLSLETNVPDSVLENGVEVYIPGSLLETHGNGNANVTWETAINNKHTLEVTHYFTDEFSDCEMPAAEYSDYGIKFVCSGFSPFVFEALTPADDDDDNDNDNGSTGSGVATGSGLAGGTSTVKPDTSDAPVLIPPTTGERSMAVYGILLLIAGSVLFAALRKKA